MNAAEGHLGAAVADAERAVSLEEALATAATPWSTVGRAYATLGRVRHAAGQDAAARSALERAVWHLDATLGADHRETRAARDVLATLK